MEVDMKDEYSSETPLRDTTVGTKNSIVKIRSLDVDMKDDTLSNSY